MKLRHQCPYCGGPRVCSAVAYTENPFCAACLHERMERALTAGVAQRVEQDVIDKLRELGHLIQHATTADRDKLPEMNRWFESYLARATPVERAEFRKAVRRLWPIAVTVLIQEADSPDPEVSAGAKLALEQMRSIRAGGKN